MKCLFQGLIFDEKKKKRKKRKEKKKKNRRKTLLFWPCTLMINVIIMAIQVDYGTHCVKIMFNLKSWFSFNKQGLKLELFLF